MKKFILCFLFLVMVFTASSQKVYFVYLQAETAQLFSVKMNEKLFNSTAAGYLILSNLKDTTYNFSIGFPQNKLQEQSFSLAINKKDHGYILKNFPDKSWGLYDLQNLTVKISPIPQFDAITKTDKQNPSAFTDILSKAADDPSLKEKTVQPKAEEKKPEVIQQEVVKKEEAKPVVQEQQNSFKEEPKGQANEKTGTIKEEVVSIAPEIYKPSLVTKKSESSNVEGFGLVFIDDYEKGAKDTIRILIPNPKSILNDARQDVKDEKKFLNIIPDTSDKRKEIIPAITKDSSSEANQAVVNSIAKNSCADIASDTDFYLLRKNMAAEVTDDNMISEAIKYFKIKCFTTLQIRNLGTLFLKEEGKYKFFDAAYPYVSDAKNFALLESELKDEYYIKRFKAMLR